MLPTAKVFTTGNSQAVRLPKAFRVDVAEMWISRNAATGEIILKPKDGDQRRRNIALLLKLVGETPASKEFIPPRAMEESRNPLEEWAEPLPAKVLRKPVRKAASKGRKA